MADKQSPLKVILVVDDDPIIVETVSRMLVRSGYRCLIASNGEEAVRIALQELPDLVLMDIRMPEIDGIAALKSLKEEQETQHIPVIMMTAYASLDTAIHSVRLGAVDYLQKPIQLHSLRLAVSEGLQKGSLEVQKGEISQLRKERDELLRRLQNLKDRSENS